MDWASSWDRKGAPLRSRTGRRSRTPTPLNSASEESTVRVTFAEGLVSCRVSSRFVQRAVKPFCLAQSATWTYSCPESQVPERPACCPWAADPGEASRQDNSARESHLTPAQSARKNGVVQENWPGQTFPRSAAVSEGPAAAAAKDTSAKKGAPLVLFELLRLVLRTAANTAALRRTMFIVRPHRRVGIWEQWS